MRDKFILFFGSKYTKTILGLFILALGLGSGLYFSGPNAAQLEAIEAQRYFELEEEFGQPEEYAPTFKLGDKFPLQINNNNESGTNYRKTFFLLLSPTCEPCEEQYQLLHEKLLPYIRSDVQIVFCFDKEYQTAELPKKYQKMVLGNRVIYEDFDFLLDNYNLHMIL